MEGTQKGTELGALGMFMEEKGHGKNIPSKENRLGKVKANEMLVEVRPCSCQAMGQTHAGSAAGPSGKAGHSWAFQDPSVPEGLKIFCR